MGISMKNLIKYYYDFEIDRIIYCDGEYKFHYSSYEYCLLNINKSIEEINDIYMLSIDLHRLNFPCHEIIKNKDNLLITSVQQKKYILLKKYVVSTEPVTLEDIAYFNLNTSYNWNYKNINRTSWINLWSKKVDYYEYQINQISKQYKFLYNTLNYYLGITENGMQILKIINPTGKVSICHDRINKNMKLTDFYNPLNFVVDYRIRDISEYCKQNLINISEYEYIKIFSIINNAFEPNDAIMFFIRSFLPTFYFDLYEKIIIGGLKTNEIIEIFNNTKQYEIFLKKIYDFIKTYIRIPKIEWLDG